MSPQEMLDHFVLLVRVIKGDAKLLEWFQSLEGKSPGNRRVEILQLAERVAGDPKGADLAASLKVLATPMIFEAVSAVLAVPRGSEQK